MQMLFEMHLLNKGIIFNEDSYSSIILIITFDCNSFFAVSFKNSAF